MIDIRNIFYNLARIAAVLRRFDHPQWADRIDECGLALPQDTGYALSRLMSLCDGWPKALKLPNISNF